MTRRLPVLLLAAALLLAGMFGCSRKAPPSAGSPTILTKNGPITEADLGVPLYPGATANGDKSFIFKGKQGSSLMQTTSVSLDTPDSVDEVERFYHGKLGHDALITDQVSSSGKLVSIDYKNGKQEARIQIVPKASGAGSIIVILTQSK